MKINNFLIVCYFLIALVHISTGRGRFSRERYFKNRVLKSPSTQNSYNRDRHSFVLLGASGDLSKREIYPALWYLYRDKLLPPNLKIIGYALHQLTIDDLRRNVEPHVIVKNGEGKLYDEFWSSNVYLNGTSDGDADYEKIDRVVGEWEGVYRGNRIFYIALPPSVFPSAAAQIKRLAMAKSGWTRIVVEKPFGRDLESSNELSEHLSKLFTEDQIYRMDHFLGYEMSQNLLPLRFANRLLSSSWNKENIAAVAVDFKENFGIEGRGSYFDKYGIIRDVMQNHLLQIAALIAMEKPRSMSPDDVRDAKVKVLRHTRAVAMEDVVIGQYVANPESEDPRERIGYREDPTVPKDSITATFALTVLKIDSDRWRGVPFIIRAGKGLNSNRTEVIVQYKDVDDDLFDADQLRRNRLVCRIGKNEAIRAELMSKSPGVTKDFDEIAMDFSYEKKYVHRTIPGAYERLLLDVFHGSQVNFARVDELSEAWRIFTPILHEIETERIRPVEYRFGTTEPREADELERRYNFLQ